MLTRNSNFVLDHIGSIMFCTHLRGKLCQGQGINYPSGKIVGVAKSQELSHYIPIAGQSILWHLIASQYNQFYQQIHSSSMYKMRKWSVSGTMKNVTAESCFIATSSSPEASHGGESRRRGPLGEALVSGDQWWFPTGWGPGSLAKLC